MEVAMMNAVISVVLIVVLGLTYCPEHYLQSLSKDKRTAVTVLYLLCGVFLIGEAIHFLMTGFITPITIGWFK